MIAEVIVNSVAKELNRVFDYGVPNNLDVVVGVRVLVPFGYRKQNEIGYVKVLNKIREEVTSVELKKYLVLIL